MKYDLKGHPRSRPLLCKNRSSTFVYGPILMKIDMINIMKTQFFHQIIYDLKYHVYDMENFCDFFTLTHLT